MINLNEQCVSFGKILKLKSTMILIILINNLYGQEIELFHLFRPTASSWDIIEWNISDTTNKVYVLKEIVDKNGYVIELQFLQNGNLIKDPLCYLANRIKFEYSENRIQETLYHFNEIIKTNDCEMIYRKVYHLDENGFITKRENFAIYDLKGLDNLAIDEIKKYVPEYSIENDTKNVNIEIDYYFYSYAKMNGFYPVNSNFIEKEYDFYGAQPEAESIKIGIKKLIENSK